MTMEITWYGSTCVRMRGREGVVAADPFRSIVGPTGRSMTADIISYSHPDPSPPKGKVGKTSHLLGVPIPTSLEKAFVLDSPGEYEVHDVMVTGVRTFRDNERGQQRGMSTAFVVELDGLYIAHLGDVGHLLTQDEVGEIGHVDIVCLGIGPMLSAAHSAEVVAQLDANLVIPLPQSGEAAAPDGPLHRFLKEMSVTDAQAAPKLNVSISSMPNETTVVVLEQRGRN
jgi:L-ascorbate metabolism protein UlaG (beta-lactamase superfamily)